MDLQTYLDARRCSQKDFAELLGISTTGLRHYISRRRLPCLKIARKIEVATKGKVSIDDLINYFNQGKTNDDIKSDASS